MIEEYKNTYEDERIFVLGNGPSLERTPLHLLSEEYTFGVNNIANIFDQTEWRPTFYLAIHSPPNIPERNVRAVSDQGTICFLPEGRLEYIEEGPNVERVRIEHLSEKDGVKITDFSIDWESIEGTDDVWSTEVSEVVYQYTTVLYPAIQIATYMGFSEIYLLGCDLYDQWDLHMVFEKGDDPATYHSESDSKLERVTGFLSSAEYPLRSFVNGVAYHALDSVLFRKTQPILRRIDDRFANQAHFYDTYEVGKFQAGHRVRNQKMIRGHRLAREAASALNFEIYNATLGGSLEVHPRVDLYELLGAPEPSRPER